MYSDITGIILSGGKSTRMGLNKSLLNFGDKTSIERISDLLKNIFQKVIIITNEPDLYSFLNLELFEDVIKGYGPISGIHSGLIYSQTEKNFFISCDVPFIDKQVIEFIIKYSSTNSIIVPKADGYVQELCGVYSKNIIPQIEKILNENQQSEIRNPEQAKRKCRVHKLIEDTTSTIIDMEKEYSGYHKNLFFNMNTYNDYEYAKKVIN